MIKSYINRVLVLLYLGALLNACVPKLTQNKVKQPLPTVYSDNLADSVNSAIMDWRNYFKDPKLISLIDTALLNNQELNIFFQEMLITKNEIRARKGEYLPNVDFAIQSEVDKVGRYTRNGALEANTEIKPGKEFPEPFTDHKIGLFSSWEIDLWRKLRNAKEVARIKYLQTEEGRNLLITGLIAEIASSYYELLALDNQLEIVKQNIIIQTNALDIIRLQKQSARVTELAVTRFEAQLLGTRSLQYGIQQQIIETENKINYLLGRYPQYIDRSAEAFEYILEDSVYIGLPAQLFSNRPDIRKAELELKASDLDVKIAKANFYPSLGINSGIGLASYKTESLLNTPESLIYGLSLDLISPLVNRNKIKSEYFNANSRQIQAIYEYEQTVLNAYIEVVNQISNIDNLNNNYQMKLQQVETLTESVEISNTLFKSARADYMEVLLTQREALESKFELIETKKLQLSAYVNIYRALGGGWIQ